MGELAMQMDWESGEERVQRGVGVVVVKWESMDVGFRQSRVQW